MLSYRHSFHAGNFADVHKHLTLVVLIEAFKRKEKPFCYIDTHSGAGFYNLNDKTAMKNQEFKEGILRLVEKQNGTTDNHVEKYLTLVKRLNTSASIQNYPGSPGIASALLREHDRLILTELHSNEFPLLKKNFLKDKRVAIHNQNGYHSLKAFIPPKEKRGLVLIDPSYEMGDEYERVAKETINAYRKWPTGCYAIWYPVLLRSHIDALEQIFIDSGIKKILVSELCLHGDDVPRRLNGSGMLIINPPWQCDETLKKVQPWLLKVLQQRDIGFQRVEWLREEV